MTINYPCLVCHEPESLEGYCVNIECPRGLLQKALDIVERGVFMKKTTWNKETKR